MQKFSLYLIKEPIADQYYHKSDILYHFLRRYSSSVEDEVYLKQFHFITESMLTNELILFIQQQYPDHSVRVSPNELYINFPDNQFKMTVQPRECIIEGSSLHEVEKTIFEHLRFFYSSFFVINRASQQFGWLSPQQKSLMI
ncbi:Protein of unknown function [Salinibacillus kushneri]|uniref:Sporulation inhibitor of replication protein SirA n=1 Tax=Salinibacillus kushneri TaxID=237682 RepID=A0A1I0E2Z4_9BACI|nr:sporulation inhibitor of replication protein SirA [Salinibacillus kushneri]SET38690.1 Protein of unknown function [Salinibacillus kushneri]